MGGVTAFPGKPLVAVLSGPDAHHVMLAKVGATSAAVQCSFGTVEEAERVARDGAAECGWRYVGVFDDARFARIEGFCSSGKHPPRVSPGPDAA